MRRQGHIGRFARSRNRSRRHGDRGAVMVEAAFVIPVMFLLFFGLTQLAFGMSTASTAVGASRTGARLASSTYAEAARSGDAATIDAALDNIRSSVEREIDGRPSQATPLTLWVYEADAGGNPSSGAACASSCIRWTWNGTAFASRTGAWADPDACGSTVDSVAVRVALDHDISSPFMGDLTIRRTTTMRLEPITDAAC